MSRRNRDYLDSPQRGMITTEEGHPVTIDLKVIHERGSVGIQLRGVGNVSYEIEHVAENTLLSHDRVSGGARCSISKDEAITLCRFLINSGVVSIHDLIQFTPARIVPEKFTPKEP